MGDACICPFFHSYSPSFIKPSLRRCGPGSSSPLCSTSNSSGFISPHLCLPRHFLLLLLIPLLALALQEFALLVGTHALEARVTSLLLAPIALKLALLGALALVRLAQLTRFLLARVPQLALHFGPEVRCGRQCVREPQEVREQGGCVSMRGGQAQGEGETFARGDFIESRVGRRLMLCRGRLFGARGVGSKS